MARYLGIEISESQVRGAVLKTAYKKLVLEGVATILRGPGPEGIVEAARELAAAASAGGTLDGVYTALPGSEVSLRVVSLPRAVWKRGERALQAELEGTVPFDVDDAIVDAQVIRGTDPVELLAAAALRTKVEGLLTPLTEGGLEPREMGVGPVCLGELSAEIPELAIPGPALLVYCTEHRADVVVLTYGVVAFARTVHGFTTPAARDRAMRQTLGAYASVGGELPVVAYLCGEEAELMASTVADTCGLPGESVSPLPNGAIELSPAAGDDALRSAPVAVALATRGLGRSRRLDLRKGPLALSGGAQAFRERVPYFAAAAGAILTFWGLSTVARYQALSAERTRLQDTLTSVTREVFGEAIDDPSRARAMARGETGSDDADPMPAADAYDVVGVLSQKIPPTTRHDVDQLDINGEHVQLQGMVDTLQDRDHVVEALGQYACFPSVRPGRATTNAGDNRQRYTLDVDFRCPEQQPHGRTGGNNAHGRSNGNGNGGNGNGSGGNNGSSSRRDDADSVGGLRGSRS